MARYIYIRQALRHLVTVGLNVRTSDLSDFESGLIVGVRRAGDSISKTSTVHFTNDSVKGFPDNGATKHPVSGSPVRENGSLMRGQRRMTS